MKRQGMKSTLVNSVLPRLLGASDYVSFARISATLRAAGAEFSTNTLRRYLSEATSSGLIFDAGRAWYSRLSSAFVLDTKPIAPLLRSVKRDFPLLDISVWSTGQINPHAHHLLSIHTAFLFAEADALPSVAEKLEDRGWKAFANPGSHEAQRRFRPGDKTVVLRPSLSKQPEGDNGAAPVEKLLVDLLAEAARLRLMDESEAQTVIANVAQAGRIQVAALLGYARRRGMEIAYFNESTNSSCRDKLDLMDQE